MEGGGGRDYGMEGKEEERKEWKGGRMEEEMKGEGQRREERIESVRGGEVKVRNGRGEEARK